MENHARAGNGIGSCVYLDDIMNIHIPGKKVVNKKFVHNNNANGHAKIIPGVINKFILPPKQNRAWLIHRYFIVTAFKHVQSISINSLFCLKKIKQ